MDDTSSPLSMFCFVRGTAIFFSSEDVPRRNLSKKGRLGQSSYEGIFIRGEIGQVTVSPSWFCGL